MPEERIVPVATAVLFAGVALVYGSLALAGFVWDDVPLIVQNEITGDLANLPRFFAEDLWRSTGSGGYESGYYRPLMLLSLAVDRALWGLSPAGHHLHSVAWHLAASALLLLLLRRLVAPLPALMGTLIFACHPLQSEAVAWVASRNDPMVATFVLAAVLVLLPRSCGPGRLASGGLLVLAATLSKESGVLAPVLLLALDLARWRRPGGLARYAAAGTAIALWLLLRQLADVHASDLAHPTGASILLERLHLVVASYGRLLLWPYPLSSGRTVEFLRDPLWQVVLGLGTVVGLAWLQARRGGALGVAGLLFSLAAVAPSLVAIASKGQVGERYLYLPMAGVALGVAAALPRRSRWFLLAVPLAASWIWILHLRLPDWQNALGLWEAAARDTPNGYAYAGYGHELNHVGRRDEAQAWFRLAVLDDPPMEDACLAVLAGPLAVGRPQEALVNARALKGRGCSATPDLMALLGTVFARNCLWDEVRETLPAAAGAGKDRALILAGALALVDREPDRYQALIPQAADGVMAYEVAVQDALDAGCRTDVVVPAAIP